MLSEKDIKALMRKLAQGIANEEERAKLHAYAEEDPFLAEALEGYSLLKGDHSSHLDEITEKLSQRTRKKIEPRKNSIGMWQKAAAIALLLAVAGWMIRGSLQEVGPATASQHPELRNMLEENQSLENEVPLDGDLLAIQREESEVEESTIAYADNPTIPINRQSDPVSQSAREELGQGKDQANTILEAQDTRAIASEKVTVDVNLKENEEQQGDVAEVDRKASSQAGGVPALSQQQTFSKESVLSGQVIDENGEPLIGAKITPLKSDLAIRTDSVGQFKLPQHAIDDGLVVTYKGYDTKKLEKVMREDLASITMTERALTPDEMQIVQYLSPSQGLQQRRISAATIDDQGSEILPKAGWNKYQRYILQNLTKPKAASDEKINGTVILSFNLNTSGDPQDIRIEKSLGFGCDEEAIRLVELGPRWIGTGDKTQRVRIEIKF